MASLVAMAIMLVVVTTMLEVVATTLVATTTNLVVAATIVVKPLEAMTANLLAREIMTIGVITLSLFNYSSSFPS